jgi:septation ring formation regulator EzrA
MERAGKKTAAVVAVAIVALAAGCGGGGGGGGRLSKSQYEQKLKSEGSHLKSAFSGSGIEQSSNVDDLTTKLTSLQKELDQSASDLEDLNPPQDAEADNAKLADALHKAADKFGELKKAAKAQDQKRLQQLTQEVGAILQEGKAASDDLKAKGYDIGTLGE